MKKTQWKTKIKKACEAAGTYQTFFDSVIDTLAGIMEARDSAQEKYEASGASPIVKHTNAASKTNIVKNPALVMVLECNSQALQYWAQLGLTPKSYKQMMGTVNVQIEARSLEDALADIGI